MITLKLGFRGVARRGWGLLQVLPAATLLFSMLTFVVATELSIGELTKPGVVQRAIRLGIVDGYPLVGSWFTLGEVNRLATIPGLTVGPAAFTDCFVDPKDHREFGCGAANRTYLQIHDYAVHTTEQDLDRWDAQKDGAIIVRAVADKYHWKVGDHITVQFPFEGLHLDLVITSISDKYLERHAIYFHHEYAEQQFHSSIFWVVWMLVDKAENRQALMDQIHADLSAVHRRHTLWKGEDTIKLLLTTSQTLRETFDVGGAFAFLLVISLAVTLLIVSIDRRTTEFAAMMAIGYRRGLLARSVIIEGVLLLFIASAVGAFSTALLFHDTPFRFDVVVSVKVPISIAVMVTLGGTLLGLITSIIPAWRLYRLDVLSALR